MKLALAFVSCLAVLPSAPIQSQVPRDTPPPVIENARRERELRLLVASGGATKDTYLELARLANMQNRIDDVVQALTEAAKFDPPAAESHHRIATLLWAYARRPGLDSATQLAYVKKGIAEEDEALALQPNYLEALTYKNILLRMQANLTEDKGQQQQLIAEADTLRNRAIELQRQHAEHRPLNSAGGPPPPAPPAPPFPGFSEPFEQTLARLQPVRVGGNIRTPIKTKDVKPVFPADAQTAGVQGVVILETIIDDQGTIANARVLRSIPMLDAAALSAVSQWQFTPTLLNGNPVGVIMTVTVNFTLME
jgi:TonB family protein